MSLSKISNNLVPRLAWRALLTRASSAGASPPPAAKQIVIPAGEAGFFNYERDYSRDKRYSNPQKPGDLPMRFLVRKLGHAYEIYPLFFLIASWTGLFFFACYISFEKMEVWLDRSQETAPWDWSRIRSNYYKKPTLVFDTTGVSHQRIELMEKLQDEMVDAAKKRGTR
uniref:NADH dehydrogenase [ubiquinone] 1 beta subcomplex subunit 11, mitochondrial n=1 Tax=Rhabditophanes sp. KR3021 TaxID=114890 RepID=A0AC35TST7_9BILA